MSSGLSISVYSNAPSLPNTNKTHTVSIVTPSTSSVVNVANTTDVFNANADVKVKNGKEVRLYNGDNYVSLKAPSLSSDRTLYLPTGVGQSGQMLSTDGVDQLQWIAAVAPSANPTVAILKDVRASGTNGGSMPSANTWYARTINTVSVSQSWVVLNANNSFNLQPGTYVIDVGVTMGASNNQRIRLRDSTNSIMTISRAFSTSQMGILNYEMMLSYSGTLAAATTFFVEHYSDASNGSASFLGLAQSIADTPEVYLDVRITKF